MPSARAACQEVRSTTAVQDVWPAMRRNCIVATTGVDEPIVIADADIQVVAGYADILVLQTADRAGVVARQGAAVPTVVSSETKPARATGSSSPISWVAGLSLILWIAGSSDCIFYSRVALFAQPVSAYF